MMREDAIELFRAKVLEAMDEAAREIFDPSRNDAGASDADLPHLFSTLDAQVDRLAKRYGADQLSGWYHPPVAPELRISARQKP